MNRYSLPRFLASLIALLAAITTACGPELDERAETDLTGVWAGEGNVVTITDIRVEIVQDDTARLRGSWSGKATPPPGNCPPGIGLAPSNIIFGSNSIAQVEFQMLGAGQFNGALVSPTRIEGRVRSCNRFYRLDLVLLTRDVPGLNRTAHPTGTTSD